MADEDNGIFEKLIELGGNSNHYYFDYEQQAKHLEDMTKYIKGEKAFKQPGKGNDDTCHSLRNQTAPTPDDAFMFAPAFTGQVTPKNPKVTFEGNCFEQISFEMVYNQATPDTFQIVADVRKPRTETCSDVFLFGNTEVHHLEEFFIRGQHTMTFKASGADAIEDLQVNGILTYLFCEDLHDELISVFTTVKAFLGGLGMHGKVPLF